MRCVGLVSWMGGERHTKLRKRKETIWMTELKKENIKQNLQDRDARMWTALDWFGIGPSDGFCGNGNEISCPIKGQEFLDYLPLSAT
jgi:hypothetical protein